MPRPHLSFLLSAFLLLARLLPPFFPTGFFSGESGAATVGCAANILLREDLRELKEKLQLDKNSRVLFISTEGDTDKGNYRKVVWGGKYSKAYEA